MISRRIPEGGAPNAWTHALASRRAAGVRLLDLTEANPTRVGLGGAAWASLAALSDARALDYAPDPLGLREAREAVARYHAERGDRVDPEHVVLTAGTSEAYAHLFRLLGEPGDRFLAPRPCYPLFEPIARLEGVSLDHHALRRDPGADGAERWRLDLDALEAAVTPRTRAAITVEPGHPTGACLDPPDRDGLESVCARHGLAIVSDEVFGDFPWPASPLTAPRPEGPPSRLPGLVGPRAVPTFVLSGLSKVCGMPQMKLSWIVVCGPQEARDEALRGLEWISDLFLSVSVPVQNALPALLDARHAFQERMRERLAANLGRLADAARRVPGLDPLPAQGGWVAAIRLPPPRDDEAWALALLERDVVVHPGYFYDFDERAPVIVSLIVAPEAFDEALSRIEALAARG